MAIRIIFDLFPLHHLPLASKLRMTGILRTISHWGERLSTREDVAWLGRISPAFTATIAATAPEFGWLAPSASGPAILTGKSHLAEQLYRSLMVPLKHVDPLSRVRRRIGFRWMDWQAPREAERILAAQAGYGDKFLYHLPVTSPLPAVIPACCRPVMSVYDLVPMIFRDSYGTKFPVTFAHTINSAKAARAHFIVNAASTLQALVCMFDIDPAHIHIVPLAAEPPPLNRASSSNFRTTADTPFFLYVSSDDQRRKNIPLVVRAFTRFRAESPVKYDLKIVGSGSAAIVAGLRVAGVDTTGVEGLGTVDAQTLEELYAAAFCGLYLSLYEGFGLPVIECMSRKLPVICSNTTSLPEVAGSAALLVNPLDIQEMVHAFHRLASDEPLRQRLIQDGYRRSLEFSWDESSRRLIDAYEKILSC